MKKHNCFGLITQRKAGGMISCKACGKLLGYLHDEHLTDGCLQFACRCGSIGYLQFGEEVEEASHCPAQKGEDALQCAECNRTWLEVKSGTKGFAFRLRCVCGTVSDIGREPRRKVYSELAMVTKKR